MKKIFKTVTLIIVCGCAAQTVWQCSAPSDKHDDEQIEWKELDDFHMVMADVFHPLKDSGNLEPIKSRAEELAASASAWAVAALPEKVDNQEVKGLLLKLKDGTRGLADQIKAGAGDDVIQEQLTDLHDLFHSIQENWYAEGEEHHQH